ncbi:MAG TPA: energy transducer TonB, partial [Terriglobales bacterium]
VPVGGSVQEALCISCPKPNYPPIARQAHIQGTVVLHAIIAKDGTVKELTVVSGNAMLQGEAERAVRQWRYHPLELNGVAQEVDTQITVNFTLGGG